MRHRVRYTLCLMYDVNHLSVQYLSYLNVRDICRKTRKEHAKSFSTLTVENKIATLISQRWSKLVLQIKMFSLSRDSAKTVRCKRLCFE